MLGPLEGPMQIGNGRVLLGVTAPAQVELWSLADGSPIWSLDVESLGTSLAQEPFFIPSANGEEPEHDLLVSFERGEIRRIDPDSDPEEPETPEAGSGGTVWVHEFPQMLRGISLDGLMRLVRLPRIRCRMHHRRRESVREQTPIR